MATPSISAGRIIFINGIPNAGKTTLAVTLQAMLPEPYWHLSLDDFLRGYTEHHMRSSSRLPFQNVMLGYMRSLRQMALSGVNIIAEAVIAPSRLDTYLDLFGDLDVLLIGLHVPLEEAQRRERQRTDRLSPYEVSARDLELIHTHGLYDLELDTARLTPEEAAQQIIALLASPPTPTAFQRLLSQRGQTVSKNSVIPRDRNRAVEEIVQSFRLPSGITIRAWNESDFPAIQRFSAMEGWPTPTERTAEAVQAWQRSWPALVAEADGAVIGFLRAITDGSVTMYIAEVFVSPECRGTGLGRALLAVAQRLCPGTRLDLLATEDSSAFYDAAGFRAFPGYRRSWAELE